MLRRNWPLWPLWRLVRLLALTIILVILVGLIFRDRFIFYPMSKDLGTPEHCEEFWLTIASGDRLRAWRLPPKERDRVLPDADLGVSGGQRPPSEKEEQASRTVLFFQGNAGNLSFMIDRLIFFNSLGLDVLAVDYPGYGPSSGRPGEELVYQSAESLWQEAVRRGAAPQTILIYGFSLGGGVASYLAQKHPPAALVLDSTFTRLRDVPGHEWPRLRSYFKLVLGEAFDTLGRLENIHCPLLVIHSPEDDIVPFDMGLTIFQAYRNTIKYVARGRGGHMDFLLNHDLYRAKLESLLSAMEAEVQRPQSD
jgi:pimeloyl-ACP methyl ester carboxylesterase